jgi:ribosomal protein S12 methylthiotransferase accessory factor YcaO
VIPAHLAAIAAETEVDLHRSPFAPGLHLAFARWRGRAPVLSALSGGTGLTAEAARLRALGEMAENLALAPGLHPAPVPALAADGRVLVADARAEAGWGSEGAAAGPTAAAARQAARLECLERAAYALWYLGALAAVPIALPGGLVRQLRQGLALRATRLFALDLPGWPAVRLAVTSDADGARMAAGTAADDDPARAAEAALREAMQAEVAWAFTPGHPDQPWRDGMDRALRNRLDRPPSPPAGPAPAPAPLAYADLTAPGSPIPVWRCICPDLPVARSVIRPETE